MKINDITWSDLKLRLPKSTITAVIMLYQFEHSGLKFYGYGSRFNGYFPQPNSDWNLLVVCSDEQWGKLTNDIQNKIKIHTWYCERRHGDLKPRQPVFSNFEYGKGGALAVHVRKIENPHTDLFHKNPHTDLYPQDTHTDLYLQDPHPQIKSDYTEII